MLRNTSADPSSGFMKPNPRIPLKNLIFPVLRLGNSTNMVSSVCLEAPPSALTARVLHYDTIVTGDQFPSTPATRLRNGLQIGYAHNKWDFSSHVIKQYLDAIVGGCALANPLEASVGSLGYASDRTIANDVPFWGLG